MSIFLNYFRYYIDNDDNMIYYVYKNKKGKKYEEKRVI